MKSGAETGKTAQKPTGDISAQPIDERTLDQWRGLALVLVLISHGLFFTGRVPGIGRGGVNLFFFISGILVFRSLLRGPQELSAGFKSFAIKRIKRLIPAKYFYLLCMTVLVFVIAPFSPFAELKPNFLNQLPSALLYFRNYTGSGEKLTGHLWSLACELQFYLLAPFIYFAGGATVARRICVFGAVLAVMLGIGLTVIGKPETQYNQYSFGLAAWPMMAGFYAEFLRSTFPRYCASFANPLVWCGLFGLMALVSAIVLAQKNVTILASTLLLGGCFGCYLKGFSPRGVIGNACHFLGNRTYSIYLWQQPLTIAGIIPPILAPFGALLAVAVGTFAFHFLERPYMAKFKR